MSNPIVSWDDLCAAVPGLAEADVACYVLDDEPSDGGNRMGKTLREMQAEIGAWGDATFPRSTADTVLSHFREEADELLFAGTGPAGSPADFAPEEAADCLILLIQFAHKCGFRLADAAEAKMQINRARTWKVDSPEPGGHVKHEEHP